MGNLFEIPDEVYEVGQDGFDDILDQLGKNCKLVYPSRWVDCENCVYDPIGKKSTNRWTTGGPIPFHAGACPVCSGQGRRASENSDTIIMTINWSPSGMAMVGPNIRVPMGGIIQTRGYLTDMPKIRQCEEMIILSDAETYGKYKFKLDGEPSLPFQIITGRYFIASWKRVG